MPKQLLVAILLFLIMAGGVAWIAFVLVKSLPILLGIFGAASVMRSRAALLKRADSRPLSDQELNSIRDLTVQLQSHAKSKHASARIERELELVELASVAVARGDWEKARTCLADVRRLWS